MTVHQPPRHTAADALAPILAAGAQGARLGGEDALLLAHCGDVSALMAAAGARRDLFFGDTVTYSRKVFIPLTQLCRDVCRYCTFAKAPRKLTQAFLSPGDVRAIARAGAQAGCKEALFTLGDKPELRYKAAREALAALGHETTLHYLEAMARLVFEETGLMPHLNPGTMRADDIARLRPVSLSMGLMLETASPRLSARGGAHYGSPDKDPAARLETIAAAGAAQIPFTSGILIGIGETRRERIEALLALRGLNDRYGHIQEIIVQNFRAKPGTKMAAHAEPGAEDHLWTLAVARLIFGETVTLQAPPNLAQGALAALIDAGIDDWGGVSPVTVDHVNPEAPWPHLETLAAETAKAGKVLAERLAANPAKIRDGARWFDNALQPAALRLSDAGGFARLGAWAPGLPGALGGLEGRHPPARLTPARRALHRILDAAQAGRDLSENEIVTLFGARGADFWDVCAAADALRARVNGDTVSYVVTRNINYTNICSYRCQFCAFSKGKLSENLRGRPYDLGLDEIARRTREAFARGATEVCLQGGIHPAYTGAHYLDILAAVKAAAPEIHVHAFSPLEVFQGAATLGVPVREFLNRLKEAGLASLPGTAAEILDDEVRAVICPDKLTTAEWLDVVAAAHEAGLKTTATIMYGHVERPVHWARHLLHLRRLQQRTGGITEFVPLPFVAPETPMFLKGRARAGATLREAVLMHAVARLVLHPHIVNIQASWVKMGMAGMALCLEAGVNDFGGTLMDESISRAAGASHGQEMSPRRIEDAVRALGRVPRMRTTLYADAPQPRRDAARQCYETRPAH